MNAYREQGDGSGACRPPGEDEQEIAALRSKVVTTALELQDSALLTVEELGTLLEYEWDRAALERDASPVSAVMAVTAQAVREVSQNPESPDVVGTVCGAALHWAVAHHLASDRYVEIVGIIAAAVVKALLPLHNSPQNA